ncbi:MAG: hypothetical protein D6744_16620 [Planctomycetota bacterium]|nr:MAG: hypothetical protein D6744_16620 [Planctomycetota bacterium]
MLYAALTFWMLVIVFTAWGVHALWSRLVKPRAVNTVLLPGTLIAQLGHVLGLLITGNAVQNTALMRDDDTGEPQTETPEKPRIPVIGPVLIGLLPLLACAAALYAAARLWGQTVIDEFGRGGVLLSQSLPTRLSDVWQLLRDSVTLVENTVDAVLRSDLPHWPTALFLYLAVCLTVRMTPFEGNRRGALGAIALSGVLIWIVGALTGRGDAALQSTWPLLSFAVGVLLFLLLFSLLVTGVVELIRIFARGESQAAASGRPVRGGR